MVAYTFVSIYEDKAKTPYDIKELCEEILWRQKDFNNKLRVQLPAETGSATIEAATTPAPVTAPAITLVPLLPYHTPVSELFLPSKVYGTQGVKAEVFATQLELYTIADADLFPDTRRKLAFSLS